MFPKQTRFYRLFRYSCDLWTSSHYSAYSKSYYYSCYQLFLVMHSLGNTLSIKSPWV